MMMMIIITPSLLNIKSNYLIFDWIKEVCLVKDHLTLLKCPNYLSLFTTQFSCLFRDEKLY